MTYMYLVLTAFYLILKGDVNVDLLTIFWHQSFGTFVVHCNGEVIFVGNWVKAEFFSRFGADLSEMGFSFEG